MILSPTRLLLAILRAILPPVPPEEHPHAVPFEATTNIVGESYLERLAAQLGAAYRRNPPGSGLMDDFLELGGPQFDAHRVHPLVRDFYEHTTNYTLTLVPHWQPLARPVFWMFRRLIAIPIEQFCFPVTRQEAAQGLTSYIDTMDVDVDGKVDVRAWIRIAQTSRQPMYVGIYTVYRPQPTGSTYVSVGFPLPDANLTATLLPGNDRSDGLVLRSSVRADKHAGDYLCDTGAGEVLRVRRMRFFSERIHVFVDPRARLRTEHNMYVWHIRFVRLDYTLSASDRRTGSTSQPGVEVSGNGLDPSVDVSRHSVNASKDARVPPFGGSPGAELPRARSQGTVDP